MSENLNAKVTESSKWAFITELTAKMIIPITNIILARLLAPDSFGILATVQMVLSFAEMLADAGTQKYIIQKEFNNDEEKDNSVLVAIYTNVFLGFILWGGIAYFSDYIAVLVGNDGLGDVFIVAGSSIPLLSLSSVQMAVMRRSFQFKKLMHIRIVMVVMPLIVTIPLAYFGYGYWSLIIGFVSSYAVQAIIVFMLSEIKLRLYYSIEKLKEMFSFATWSLIESIFIWLTTWCDIFIVGYFLSPYYLGLYRMSMACVQSLFSLITGSIMPVLFSALSRLQYDEEAYRNMFFRIHKRTALIVIPLGFGVFAYRDLARLVLFGEKWYEADMMIGLWGLTLCINIIYSYFCSEVYRSKGRPNISTLAQSLHMFCLIPTIYCYSSNFSELVWIRNIAALQFSLVHFILMYHYIKINPILMIRNTWYYVIAAAIVCFFVTYTREVFNSIWYDWGSIAFAMIIYFCILCFFKEERLQLKNMFIKRRLI